MLGPAGAGAGARTRENFTVLQIAVWSRSRGAQLIASHRPRTQPAAGMQGQSSAGHYQFTRCFSPVTVCLIVSCRCQQTGVLPDIDI